MSSESETDEELIKYGTPLDPLDEDEIPKKKPCLLEEQIVRDKQGKRRFHGAFTGGFSAGFFNTVGSVEGWKPSSFRSSKSQKQIINVQKPEDYMDDEDTNEFGISPIILKAKENYESHQNLSNLKGEKNAGSFLLNELLKPIRETVGLKLLSKMGWKQGQGIGPRARKKEKQKASQFQKKIYGCKPLIDVLDEEENEKSDDLTFEWADITFAPDDYELLPVTPKNNFFGIGYQGLQRNSVLGFTNRKNESLNFLLNKCNKKFNIRGQAFGVGVFEEEDEDVYSRDDLSQYDYILPHDNNKGEESNEIKKTTLHGRNILDGFTMQSKKTVKKMYQLPTVPKSFKFQHQFKNSQFKHVKNIEGGNCNSSNPLPSQERFSAAICKTKQNEKINSTVGCLTFNINSVKEDFFMPFKHDPAKQQRFANYLNRNTSQNKAEPTTFRMIGKSNDKEEIEFQEAAKLLKPLTETLENRFLPAKQVDDVSNSFALNEQSLETNENWKDAEKPKIFDFMTRSTYEWFPSPLLCKRFNVPDPQKGASEFCQKKESSFMQSINFKKDNEAENKSFGNFGETTDKEIVKNEDNANQGKKLEELNVVNDSKIDMFKAIFLASSDEEDNVTRTEGEMKTEENLIDRKKESLFCNIFEKIEFRNPNNFQEPVAVLKQSNAILDSEETYGPKMPEKLYRKDNSFFTVRDSDDTQCWVEKKLTREKRAKRKKKEKKSKKHRLKQKSKRKKHKK